MIKIKDQLDITKIFLLYKRLLYQHYKSDNKLNKSQNIY